MSGWLERWLEFQRRQTVLVLACLAALSGFGVWVVFQSEVEAFPDVTNVQVQVITQYPGKAAEEVERRVTVPLEVATNGLRGLINQRSISLFGLSVITLTFDDDVAVRQARLDTAQRLTEADLPEGLKPALSPESTPVGEVFRYTVNGDLPIDELRLIEDWTLEREFKSIPGVADVVSFGGPTRTVEIRLDPLRLSALGLSASDVAQALGQNHANAGGSIVTHGQEAFVVRSLGLYENAESLEAAVVGTRGRGVPIRVRDIGRVRIGQRMRLGQVGIDDTDDAVEGIILLRKGSEALKTCAQIRDKLQALNAALASRGVRLEPYYDRTDLIRMCSRTILHNIAVGIGLVCLLLGLGFGAAYWPMILAVALVIPFALLTAFVGLRWAGVAPNLISLGAVDFGIIVETAIFAAEAAIFALRRRDASQAALTESLKEVIGPALVCALLLVIAFVPILSLQRVEGRIFKPLGLTLISALVGGQLGALLFVPLFSLLVPRGPQSPSLLDPWIEAALSRAQRAGHRLSGLPRLPWAAGAAAAALLGLLALGLGREFLPQLNEGALYIRATAPATISREAAVELAHEIRLRLRRIPEVTHAVSQIGRPDDGTDVNGFDNIEVHVDLLPPGQWRSARSIDGFIAEAQKQLADIPGVDFNYSQPIKDNVDEAISGVKGELVAKVTGPDITVLQGLADRIAELVRGLPGAEDVAAERLLGQPELRFTMNRDMLARYGLRVVDAEDALETALLGKDATKLVDEQGRMVDVVVRPDLPDAPTRADLAGLSLLTPDGARVSLSDVAWPGMAEGVARVYREQARRRVAVKTSVRGRPVVDFVADADSLLARRLKVPSGYSVQWSGSFENAQRAGLRLAVIVPLCVAAIVIVLFAYLQSWPAVGAVLWEAPFSLLGGLAALRLAGLNLSISAAAGAIVVLGVSLLTGMMLLEGWLHHRDPWAALKEEGRGILLSSGVAIVGLIPAAFSRGIGAETARPFAVMILGGLASSLVLTLLLLPALLSKSRLPGSGPS